MILEAFLIGWLNDHTEYDAFSEVPEGHPAEFYTVERTGSRTVNRVTTVTVAIQSWNSASMYAAAKMNDDLKREMEMLVQEPEISACRLSTDYNFTDTDSKYYRYQAVYNITTF